MTRRAFALDADPGTLVPKAVLGLSDDDALALFAEDRAQISDGIALALAPAGRRSTVNLQLTDYTLAVGDEEDIVVIDSAAPAALTVPEDSGQRFPSGARLVVVQGGVGQVSLVPDGATVIHTLSGNLTLVGQWARVALEKLDVNEWLASGDITP